MDFLFWRVWWSYDAASATSLDELYHDFNLAEAACWLVFAVLVAARFVRFRHSWQEPLYSLTFLAFGLTDVCEAWRLTSWLIAIKLANLIALLWLRHRVINAYYPGSKLY